MANPYETDALLRAYLLLHFGNAADIFDGLPGPENAVDFPARCVRELRDPAARASSALDVGCAVGGSSFELARHCERVTGIDYSRGFIDAARELAASGHMDSLSPVEGDRVQPFRAKVDPAIDRPRVSFAVGDAMNLDPGLENFDIVLAANLICRLPDPRVFLARLPSLVKPGGQLLLATPFSWLEDYTPKENWLGGDRPSFDVLTEILSPDFDLELRVELPFVIREHARKFQYGVSLGSRWRRKLPTPR